MDPSRQYAAFLVLNWYPVCQRTLFLPGFTALFHFSLHPLSPPSLTIRRAKRLQRYEVYFLKRKSFFENFLL